MGKAIPVLHYMGNDIQLEDLPLLDNEFDIVDEENFDAKPTVGEWSQFLDRYTGVQS
jgi:hypothetical protein